MRTTLNIDDDLVRDLKRAARQSKSSLRVIVNTALRRGLVELEPKSSSEPCNFPSYDMGEFLFNVDKALALAENLEDAEIVRKLELRK